MDSWRVTLLGDGGVGKTALALQFTMNCFVENYEPTLEDVYRKQLSVDERLCFVEVIDTAGQQEYSALQDQWVREGQGFILVYSVTSRSSFTRLEDFHSTMIRIKRSTPVFIIVGNKSDQTKREVTPDEGRKLAQKFNCQFMETSAKTSLNVETMFTYLVRTLRQSIARPGLTPSSSGTGKAGKKDRKKIHCVIS